MSHLVPEAYAGPRSVSSLFNNASPLSLRNVAKDASSDLSVRTLETVAEDTGSGFVVNGRKRRITNRVVASWAAVLVRTGSQMNMLLIALKNPACEPARPT
ncbi:hypothetical protein [Mycobacterium paraintracellulare]|uniref:hypothetical protein n=1 Tax=Mycobacterium paraintracellulare TaxID=1138383 RepID=UPI00193861CE|nr:hypothetical protein [Mycobacterium paraintracellulare]BCP14116.1 hypothetical protein MINTM021_10250 [Mycobacterium paraintracellulare]